MKLKERISWLMGTIQHNLFPYLDKNLPSPLTEHTEFTHNLRVFLSVRMFHQSQRSPALLQNLPQQGWVPKFMMLWSRRTSATN